MSAALLVRALRDPASVEALRAAQWNALLAAAKAERLIATLAVRLEERAVPPAARAVLDDARADAEREAQQALWEADRAAFALRGTGVPPVLLKGARPADARRLARTRLTSSCGAASRWRPTRSPSWPNGSPGRRRTRRASSCPPCGGCG